MQVILIRHGNAGAYTQPDHERNLSELGKAQAEQTAAWLAANYQPTLFIHSPYNRAAQTCDIVRANFADVPLLVNAHITPDDDAAFAVNDLANTLDTLADDSVVVIVFHMNIIAKVASIITGEAADGFDLAEARVYDTAVFAPGLATEISRFAPNL
jgi:phosphohistidine phosphatase